MNILEKWFIQNKLEYQKIQKETYLSYVSDKLKILYFQKEMKYNTILNSTGYILIWYDQLMAKPAVIFSRLAAILGLSYSIPARACRIKKINRLTASAFLDEHHLQGGTKGQINLGLYLPAQYFRLLPAAFNTNSNELLLGVMTFNNPRTFKKSDRNISSHELVRFCVFTGFSVIGGLGKLLSFYEKNYQPDEIMTYIDADWSSGEGFQKVGFQVVEKMPPMALNLDKSGNRVKTIDEVAIWSSGIYKLKKYYNYGQ